MGNRVVHRNAKIEDKDERNEWKKDKGADYIYVTRIEVNNINRHTLCSS